MYRKVEIEMQENLSPGKALVRRAWNSIFEVLKEKYYQPRVSVPEGNGSHVHTETCVRMFSAAVFGIVSNWKQLRCLSAGQRIKTLCCIHSMEYYSAIKILNYGYTLR